MAKIKLGNVKGPKGDQGVRGSKWYNTDKITGTSTSGTAFPNSGIADAMVGDMALNPTTLNLYTCQTAGNAATAKWVFMACIKGPQGAKGDKGDPTTVDAALSKDSTNPIQNKAVATKIQDVEDSLGQLSMTGDRDISDANVIDNGVYHVSKNCNNVPFSYGVIMQFGSGSTSSGYRVQIAMDIQTKMMHCRGYLEGKWCDWSQIQSS